MQYLTTPSGAVVSTTAIHEAAHGVVAYTLGLRGVVLDLCPTDDSPGRCHCPGLDDLPLAARQMIAVAGALANLASTQSCPAYCDIYGRMSPGDRDLGQFTGSDDRHFRCACRAVDSIFAAGNGLGWEIVTLLAERVEARRVLTIPTGGHPSRTPDPSHSRATVWGSLSLCRVGEPSRNSLI